MIYSLGARKLEIKGEDYYIADNATVIGSVVIHNNVSIWFNAVLRGDNEPLVIEEGSNIQDGVVIHTDEGVPFSIGKGVTVGHQAMLHGCIIGDNSLIGINSVILNNSKIGKNCIVGANALVTHKTEIPDNTMVLGSPAKVVREVTEKEIEYLKFSADHYIGNFKRFKKELKREG